MSLDELQEQVKKLYEKNGGNTPSELLLIAMQEELGEISARFLAEHPDYKKDIGHTHPLNEEIGDLITLILAFCNRNGINASEWVENTINKRSGQG